MSPREAFPNIPDRPANHTRLADDRFRAAAMVSADVSAEVEPVVGDDRT
jgi:hypothetical protein